MTCAGIPPSGSNITNISNETPTVVIKALDLINGLSKWWVGRYQVKVDFVLMKPKGSELERIKEWVEEGKIKPVVGKVLEFKDLEGIREECMRMSEGKGGVGKVVIEIVSK